MTEISNEITERLRAARGFIFDMDGTIALGDHQSGGHVSLPGAIELLALLHARSIPIRVFTNGSAKPPAAYAASLRRAGFGLADHEMMTPSTAAAAWFKKRRISKVRVLGNEGVRAPLVDAGITVIGASEQAKGVEAVYTGWFREFTFPDLEAACGDVWAGAILTTASHVPFFAAAGGRAIGSSYAINKMISAMTGKQPKILGKPSRAAFDVALAGMGLPRNAASRIAVFGDDPALEMRMAHSAGALAVGMTTGLQTRESFASQAPRDRADLVLDQLEPVIQALGG